MKILLNIVQYILLISGAYLLVVVDWRIALGISLLVMNATLGFARYKARL